MRGFSGFSAFAGFGAAQMVASAPLAPLDPFAASRPVTAAYGLRRLRAAYAGNCLQVRDSGNVLRTVGFNAQGDMDTSGFASWGNGTFFSVATLYDQSGNGHNFTSTTRPVLVFPNAPTNYDGAYIDWQSKNQNMVTASTPLNVGGTANISVFAICQTFGWSSAGTHPRNPAVFNSQSGAFVGYGTGTGVLVSGAAGTDAETTMYGATGSLFVDASTDFGPRWRNVWFNQTGALVSGGGDTRQLFTGRPHGVASATNQRIVLGSVGAANQSVNGALREVIIFNNAGALTDLECQRIALWQRQYWTGLANNNYPDRFVTIFSGQSNAQYYNVPSASGNGSAGTDAHTRIFLPDIRSRLSIPANPLRELVTYGGASTAIGGSAIIKTPDTVASDKYWWDNDTNGPGPSLTLWLDNVTHTGRPYRRTVIMWAQGEAEATMITGGADVAARWKAETKLVWAAMRAHIGYDCPIVIQPLGLQTGHQAAMNQLRAIQTELAAEVPNVTVGTETTDLQLQDSVHFSSSLQGPNQSANGYDLGATRLAAVIGPTLLGMAAR